MLSSDTKYGFRGFQNSISADLIRQSYEPDPCPEYGMHHFQISLGLADAQDELSLINTSYALWHPIQSLSDVPHAGRLPLSGSFASLKSGSAVLQSVKLAEDGSGDLIARLYSIGGETQAVLAFAKTPKSVQVVDIHENPASGTASVNGNDVAVSIGAESLVTVRIAF